MVTEVLSQHRSPTRWNRRRREQATAWFFIAPAIGLVLAVTFVPVLEAVSYSLHQTTFLVRKAFVGLRHYAALFSDPGVHAGARSLLTFTLWSIVISVPLGTFAAILLNQPIRFRTFFRTVILLPWMISQLVTALLWGWLVNALYGPLTYGAASIGLGQVNFLGDPAWAMAVLVTANVWHTYGFVMILVLAALQTVPRELYEAARCDGAGAWNCFRWVTLPYIKHALLISVIIQSMNDVNMVVLPLVLTGGGPFEATELLGIRVYREAFENWNIGFASAISVAMLLINVVLSLAYIWLIRNRITSDS